MEMTAAIEGLKSISVPSAVTIITDSAYLLNTMKNRWYERWEEEEENQRRSKRRPNMDLWRHLVGLTSYHTVTWLKIKGHSGDYWNERADLLADLARRQKLSSRNEIYGFMDGERCAVMSPSDKQCKLHRGHLGQCFWTNGKANGVAPYDNNSVLGE
jgi:ribonuclease HI